MDAIAAVAAIPSALQSASATIQRSLKKQNEDSQTVASSTQIDARDTVQALVDSKQQLLYTQAAAKLIRAEDAMTRTLLDVHA